MNCFLINDRKIGKDDPSLDGLLAKLHKPRTRPLCLCRDPGIEMYIAKVGDRHIIKRMPNTGSLHSPDCDSYEPPPELSGLGDVLGTAIRENTEDGLTELRFGFSMSKIPGRVAQTPGSGDSDSVRTDGNKLTLKSTLHYLWEEAGFNRWTPAMEGKRNWHVVRKHLLQTAENKLAKGAPLVNSLYIPEPFTLEKKDAISQRRQAQMAKLKSAQSGTRQMMILIGEVKEILQARFGHKMIVKHAPDFQFLLNDDIHNRLLKRYATDLELWESLDDVHLVAVATFSLNAANLPAVEELALMTVTSNWVPFESICEKAVIDALTAGSRRFAKGLRYNLPKSKPLASVVLSDTTPLPTAMYIVPTEIDEEYATAIDALAEGSQLPSWTWNTHEFEMPEIPPAAA